jgi:hypothetical protein
LTESLAYKATHHLLETYCEAREVMGKGEGRGDGDRVPLMSSLWHASCPKNCIARGQCRSSYQKLEKLLARLKSEHPFWYWHVAQRYLNAIDRVIQVKVVRDKHGATPVIPAGVVERGAPAVRVGERTADVAVRIYDPSVNLDRVHQGVEWLAVELVKVDGVWLPSELLEAA